ncbi:probable 2-oxoglutarate-dependent dioxygenase SLC1 [Diospyros lotus]|uniref:probable 2-oxoglutarate-dependent dioxygenase SLC1 n=1 Tax=Diospyros lotus TaxID=55363 RepID=UPI002252691D|nr:probable 2-oxoglutarate-dependent dioxygenase SLC1 [Diospyros lotus]
MSPAMSLQIEGNSSEEDQPYQKGVEHLRESGITKVPTKYIFPFSDRPQNGHLNAHNSADHLNLPVIDFAELQSSNRSHILQSLTNACEEYGFFQLINHGISKEVIASMIDASRRFFELPFDERAKYMSADLRSLVRYGTSFNQNTDGVFCWRDFLKLSCHSLPDVLPFWPSSPLGLREAAVNYSKQIKFLYEMVMEAILESLGLMEKGDLQEAVEDGSQMMVVNCYPRCPEPELTLGIPPHSDYGLLTLLLQDDVRGLQIRHHGRWVTVEPIPNSFVVNIGDHLEIFSNGRYKSVLHRVLVNSSKSRISVASLHSKPFDRVIRPSPKLINEANPKRYMDTDFATFLEFISSHDGKSKNFLESRKLVT